MGDVNRVNQQVQPLPQAQPAQRVGAPIQMPEGIKVEKKTATELQQLQQKSAQASQLGQVGTRAQIDALKARVENMDMQGAAPPPELGALDTVAKYGGMALSTVGGGLAGAGRAVKNYFAGGFIEAHDNRSLGGNVSQTAQGLQTRATDLRSGADTLAQQRTQLSDLLNADDPDWGKIDGVLKDVGAQLEKAGLPTESVSAARQALYGDITKVRDVLGTISAAMPVMRAMADSAQSKSEALGDLGASLTHEGNRGAVRNTVDVVQKVTPIVSATNFIAQGVSASKTAQSFADTLSSGAGQLVQGGALTGIMVGGGALQIVSEGIELYQNVGLVNKALDRVEMARALLADGPGRDKMAAEFDKKANELENPQTRMGKIGMFFSRKSSRLEEVADLRAKAAAIRKLPAGPISDEAKTVAQQVVKRADIGFKAIKIMKNVLGIAAGAVAIAVAVGALATPVGWALAGAALAATVGCAIYCKVKGSQRQGKIDDLKGVIQQSTIKQETKGQQIQQLQGQIQQIQGGLAPQIHEQNRLTEPRRPEQELRFQSLGSSISKSRATLAELQGQLETLQTEVRDLRAISSEASVQLLGASPDEGAKQIIAGVKAGNAEMRYLAETVLGVPHVDMLPEADAIKLLKRGMSLDPSK